MLIEADSTVKLKSEIADKRAEMSFLRTVQEFGQAHAFDQFRPSPAFVEALGVELTIIPGRFLPVVCGKDKSGKIATTPMGKIVTGINQRMGEIGVEGYFLLTSGAAKEAVLGAKPFSKTRTNSQGTIPIDEYDPLKGRPKLDGDIILVIDSVCLTEEFVTSLAKETENRLVIRYYSSPSRPLPRVEIYGLIPDNSLGFFNRERWGTVGHLFFPQVKNIHDPTTLLTDHVFSQDTNTHYILLVKTNTEEGFVGVGINFFPKEKKPKIAFDQIRREGKELNIRKIKVGRIPCFENCYPMKSSPPEAYAKFWHLLREVTWDNCLRLATNEEATDPQTIKALSKETSLRFAQKIIYPIAKNSSLIIKDATSMRHQTNRTFEGLAGLLNGDPYLGFQYLLPAGLNLTDAPVFGMGIIDEKGIFPELYKFLREKDRFGDLLAVMERCDWGTAQLGWPTFVAYIYEQTGRNLRQVDELLCPVFCSNEIFPTLVDNYVRKALSRFYPIPLRDPRTGTFPRNN